ncbi:MAG: hypothetical protein JSV03_03565 [Planctomycetota bacterium]|nr:MAG: hypothetical protein JSV03_03565 [Planctomycetota bacterium]
MYTIFYLTLVLICLCGCVSDSGGSAPKIPPDPPVAEPVYGKQDLGIAKPSALEFWVKWPKRHNHPWNIIRMWFPENSYIKDENGKQIWNLPMVHDPAVWENTETGLRAEIDLPGGGRFIRTIEKDGATLYLSVSVENKSDTTWQEFHQGSCLQLSAAPDYEDNTGERTYWVLDGELKSTYQMAITSPGKRGSRGIGEKVKMKDDTEKTVSEGVAFVTSRDGKYVLGYSWQPAHGLFYNRAGIVACVHVQPPNLKVEAGQTKTQKGIIFIHEGNLKEAYQRYHDWKEKL